MNLTLILVILTGIISYQAFNNPAIKTKLLFHPVTIRTRGEWFRFLTHGFVHANWGHLLVNMFVLYQFGELIESYFGLIFGESFGRIIYLVFYFVAIVLSSVPSYYRHLNNPAYAAVGASGGTSAVVLAFVFFHPWEWFIFPPLPAILFAIGYLWYSSYMDKRGMDNIGHNAHFWGAVFGIVFTAISVFVFQPEMFDLFVNQLLAGPKPPPFFN